MRAKAVEGLGEFGKRDLVEPILQRLETERDDDVRQQIMLAMELLMGVQRTYVRQAVRTDRMTQDQRDRFTDILVSMLQEVLSDSLRLHSREWPEVILHERAKQAHTLALKAELAQAESLLISAHNTLPDSKHINFKLGRFYFDFGHRERGERILHENNCLIYVPRLKVAPTLDGNIEDPGWEVAERVTSFDANSGRISVTPAISKSEVLIGHHDGKLYVGLKAFEESMENVIAPTKPRDAETWMDDSFGIHIDANGDRGFYSISCSASGTLADSYHSPEGGPSDRTFDSGTRHGFSTDADHWYVEFEIPIETLEASTEPGTAWFVQMVRNAIGNHSEHAEWKKDHWQVRNTDRWGLFVFK